jgi:mannose-1-phosphate guanylyltransferase
LVVTLGVDNLVIVDNGNAILVCDRSKSQEIKSIVKYLTDNEMVDYL